MCLSGCLNGTAVLPLLILQAGEQAYRDRLAELRLVRATILALQRDLSSARREGAATADLRRELHFLSKQLTHEQAKTKALSLELETPLNVHRCHDDSPPSFTAFANPMTKGRVTGSFQSVVFHS